MVDAIGGLLTVVGGAGAGGFGAVEEQARRRLFEDALRRRDENLARLHDFYASKRDKRQHEYGLLKAEKQHGYRMKELGESSRLAGERAEETFQRGILQREKEFHRGILQREKEFEERLAKEDQVFKQRLEEKLAAARLEVDIRDEAKIELEKKWEFMEKRFGKEKADAIMKQSILKITTDKPGDLIKIYSGIYTDYIELLTGGVSEPTAEQKAQARDHADSMFAIMGMPLKRPEAPSGSSEDLYGSLRSSVTGGKGADDLLQPAHEPTTGTGFPASAEAAPGPKGEEKFKKGVDTQTGKITVYDQNLNAVAQTNPPEVAGTTRNGFKFGYSDYGVLIFFNDKWKLPNDTEWMLIREALGQK